MLASLAITLSALSAIVSAQIPAGLTLPACVLTCTIANAGNSTCMGVGNITCLCTDVDFQSNVTACYGYTCNSTDYVAALLYGNATCAANGTPINITAALLNATNGTNTTTTPSGAVMTTVPLTDATAATPSTAAVARRTIAAQAAAILKRETGAADKPTQLVFGGMVTAAFACVAALAFV